MSMYPNHEMPRQPTYNPEAAPPPYHPGVPPPPYQPYDPQQPPSGPPPYSINDPHQHAYTNQGYYTGQLPRQLHGGHERQDHATIVAPPSRSQPTVIVTTGNCPRCCVGIVKDSFGCCAICLAILFFPFGIICCYLMRQEKCQNCGFTL